ncbi:transport and Golgi organization protein 6-like protein [Leptotrombidium deliense]|uniref:Transport and Golgi organization protein 6-like protein n=1 Tax=Leptotrombidium deliense TaxID=299467 RepID=A0A443SQJ7_9ACAR|nr:transport and Golgi organization protein 6-like protein [Leptotrombidium deliense]
MEHCKSNEECVALCTNLKKKMIDLSENVREKQDKAKLEFEEALADINDNEVHIRTHGLVVMRRLILHKNEQAMKEKQRLIIVIQALLCDQESYVYLAAIKALAALAICSTEEVLPSLFDAYRDKQRSLQERVNVGEVLLNLVKDLGGAVQKYSKLFINEFLRSMKDDEPTMRISSLSNLGQVCSLLRFAISPYIVEIFNAVKCMLETDPILEVKRASIMFIHVMLSGIDGNSIQAIEPEISNIYRLVKHVYNRSLDDVVQFHCQLAFDQFDKIGKEMLTLRQENVHTIHFT